MLPDDGLGDGQPQAEAPLGAAAVGPVKPVEQMGQHLRGIGGPPFSTVSTAFRSAWVRVMYTPAPWEAYLMALSSRTPATCCSWSRLPVTVMPSSMS